MIVKLLSLIFYRFFLWMISWSLPLPSARSSDARLYWAFCCGADHPRPYFTTTHRWSDRVHGKPRTLGDTSQTLRPALPMLCREVITVGYDTDGCITVDQTFPQFAGRHLQHGIFFFLVGQAARKYRRCAPACHTWPGCISIFVNIGTRGIFISCNALPQFRNYIVAGQYATAHWRPWEPGYIASHHPHNSPSAIKAVRYGSYSMEGSPPWIFFLSAWSRWPG